MYRQVYFHRTLRSAETILRSILRRALDLHRNGDKVWFAQGTSFEKILKGERLSLQEHLSIDDTDVMFHIKQWQHSGDKVLSDLSTRFLNRKLFKIFDLDMPVSERDEFLAKARLATEKAGYDPAYYFVEDRSGDVPYYFYTKDNADPKNLIYVEEGYSSPQIREISEVSAAVRGLQKGYKIHRLCFPPEVKEEIAKLYHRREKAVRGE
jgi:uncharacterized protein